MVGWSPEEPRGALRSPEEPHVLPGLQKAHSSKANSTHLHHFYTILRHFLKFVWIFASVNAASVKLDDASFHDDKMF